LWIGPYELRSITRAKRSAGCDLRRSEAASAEFLVQTYARDNGEIVTALTAPIFVKGERWGAVLLGWNA
jgi:methyl-accepting chemotaxis protein